MQQADTTKQSRLARGKLVAELLSGSWSGSTPTLPLAEFERITPLLLTAGAGGLAWCGIRSSPLRKSKDADLFHAAYRMQSLRSALHERSLRKVIPALRNAGVEPLLVKGWAIARLYPEAGMRPYIDLDLCVKHDDYMRAQKVLGSGDYDDCIVDLHDGFGKFYDRRTDEIFERSRLVKLDGLNIRVLSPEDDLRFICLHLLRHGAVQPLWLCDVALLLETRADDFEWDRCLGGSRREADWVACAIGLAHQLLGARVEGTPVAHRSRNLPKWLLSTVLEEWGMPMKVLPQMVHYLRDPGRWLPDLPKELSRHWPNPIEATMTVGGSFSRLPRLPFQIGHLLSRGAAMFSHLVVGFSNGVVNRS